jgi:hypothetical protein
MDGTTQSWTIKGTAQGRLGGWFYAYLPDGRCFSFSTHEDDLLVETELPSPIL